MEKQEPREIEVGPEDTVWLEHDRDVKITLHHSGNHATSIKINEAEATDLHRKLGAEIDRRHPAGTENLICTVLEKHVMSARNKRCACGWRPDYTKPDPRYLFVEYAQHRAHVATEIAEALREKN